VRDRNSEPLVMTHGEVRAGWPGEAINPFGPVNVSTIGCTVDGAQAKANAATAVPTPQRLTVCTATLSASALQTDGAWAIRGIPI